MKANILIIEDVREMSDLVAMYLQKEGIETVQAETAELALAQLQNPSYTPDLVILDLNLPGMDGFEFLNRFRKDYACPVIIVSARDADEDIITGLGYGADEFVTKPFSPRVLVARVRAVLRRQQDSQYAAQDQNTVRFGCYVLDTNSFTLKKTVPAPAAPQEQHPFAEGVPQKQTPPAEKTERVPLSAKEYAVLACLVENAGKPLTPEAIYNLVWQTPYGDLSAVAVYIQRLRKKIEDDPANPRYIQTVFGMGYKFVGDEP